MKTKPKSAKPAKKAPAKMRDMKPKKDAKGGTKLSALNGNLQIADLTSI